jgi:poly(hydroxyalkanoate) depolymerase family esterase
MRMSPIDWRELYASNQAVIQQSAGGRPSTRVRDREARSRFSERTFTVAGKQRRALVHPPRGADRETAVPLVCMLHGCTQDAQSFAAATRMNDAADRHGFVVVYPQQEQGENPQRCWNWFVPEHQARGAGEPASIVAIVRELMGTTSDWTIDAQRVFVAGLSAGGAMAAILAAVYPDLFAAVAVHSGLAYRSATTMGAAFNAMAHGSEEAISQGRAAHAAAGALARPVPSIVLHGAADRTVAPVNARQVLEQSMAANRLAAPETYDFDIAHPTNTVHDEVPDGHAYTRRQWTDRRGTPIHELVEVDGLGHAWSGGLPGGSYTDPRGPDASEAIWRFFAHHRRPRE